MASINKVILCGTVSPRGVEMRFTPTGAACAAFQLIVSELGSDGKEHVLYQPCEVYGERAELVRETPAGALCLFEGKLARRKKGEQWETIITGYDLQRVGPPQGAAHA